MIWYIIVMYIVAPNGHAVTVSYEDRFGRFANEYTCEAHRRAYDTISDARGNFRGPTACIPVVR